MPPTRRRGGFGEESGHLELQVDNGSLGVVPADRAFGTPDLGLRVSFCESRLDVTPQ
jgi:hypothetical protein